MKQWWTQYRQRRTQRRQQHPSPYPSWIRLLCTLVLCAFGFVLSLLTADVVWAGIAIILLLALLEGYQLIPARWRPHWLRSAAPWLHRLRHVEHRIVHGPPCPALPSDNTTCAHCAHTYSGHYCPRCGQSALIQRHTWRLFIREGFSRLFNTDCGFWRTLSELFYRPGYFLRDYLAGHRIPYLRPLSLLAALLAIYAVQIRLIDPELLSRTHPFLLKEQGSDSISGAMIRSFLQWQEQLVTYTDTLPLLHNLRISVAKWWDSNNIAVSLLYLPLLSFAASAASHTRRKLRGHYNLAEHFVVQTYTACQLLLIAIVLLPLQHEINIYRMGLLFLLLLLNYRPLYQLSWGATLCYVARLYLWFLLLIGVPLLVTILLFILFAP